MTTSTAPAANWRSGTRASIQPSRHGTLTIAPQAGPGIALASQAADNRTLSLKKFLRAPRPSGGFFLAMSGINGIGDLVERQDRQKARQRYSRGAHMTAF